MAEIRVRDANPKLVEQLEAIGKSLGEQTIAGTLVKLIPRYHDMQKRIEEQNRELGDLSQLLRAHESLKSDFVDQYEDFIDLIANTESNVARAKSIQKLKLASIKLSWAKRIEKNKGTKSGSKKVSASGSARGVKKIVPRKLRKKIAQKFSKRKK